METITIVFSALSVVLTAIYVCLTRKLVFSQFGPKLYVVGEIIEIEKGISSWDKSLMSDFNPEKIKGKGFVYKSANKKWNLKIYNNGNRPAANIKLNYTIKTYKHDIKFGIDEADILDYTPVDYKSVSKKLEIDYLPPNTNESYTIFFMSTFPKADLLINLLKCDGGTFIEKEVRVSKYFNEEFEYIKDSPHLKKLLGLMDE